MNYKQRQKRKGLDKTFRQLIEDRITEGKTSLSEIIFVSEFKYNDIKNHKKMNTQMKQRKFIKQIKLLQESGKISLNFNENHIETEKDTLFTQLTYNIICLFFYIEHNNLVNPNLLGNDIGNLFKIEVKNNIII